MEMESGAIDKICELRDEGAREKIGDLTFVRGEMKPVFFAPRPDPVKISTLTGLVAYLEKNIDEIKKPELMLHVEDVKRVSLVSKLCGINRKRDIFATATVDEKLQEYPFERYMVVEEFVIRLRSMFQLNSDLERIIAYTSNLSSGMAVQTQDDGISQTLTVKVGVTGALKRTETAPVIVILKPYRSFRELDQVESNFLFRIRTDEDGKNPVCALFEADGGKWRNDTVLNIKCWLEGAIKDIAIIA